MVIVIPISNNNVINDISNDNDDNDYIYIYTYIYI